MSASSWFVCAGLTACTGLLACGFDPIARKADARKVSERPEALVQTLDPLGNYLLVHDRDGADHDEIVAWQEGTRCAVEADHPRALRPLIPPQGADSASHAFYLPRLADADAETDAELVMVDERCKLRGPYGFMRRDSAQYMTSVRDGRSILIARDAAANALVFDPFGRTPSRVLANNVSYSRPASTDGRDVRDVVWLVEGERLVLRSIEGRAIVALGSAVSEASLSADQRHVAFIDGGELYDAAAPDFQPRKLASDACTPAYVGNDLGAFSPCGAQQFVALYAGAEELTPYDAGVVAVVRAGDTELRYVARDERLALYVSVGGGAAVLVTPTLLPKQTHVFDDGRLLGVSEDGVLGTFTPTSRKFTPIVTGVARVLTEYRGKSHSYSLLVHHDLQDGLGTLSVVEAPKISVRELARGVPPQDRQGFLLEEGRAFPSYPFAAPTVVLLADAAMDEKSVNGSLRAQLITEPNDGTLAHDVSAYLLVARPLPGVLYSVQDGDRRGLWFASF